jgi:glutamine synthetase
MNGSPEDPIGQASGVEAVQEVLCADFRSALMCLQKDTFLLDLLGEKLSKGYVAVKEAEIEHSKDLSLEQELNALITK